MSGMTTLEKEALLLGAAESLAKSGCLANLFEWSELFATMIWPEAKGPHRAAARQNWFWVLLPKQKDLGCRDEPRQHKKPR
jgi:hypothetical protein